MAAQGTTLQSNIKQYNANNQEYAIFLGGLNTTRESLTQYDPLRTGYARIFFVRMPAFMDSLLPDQTKRVKHILEYGSTGIEGLQNLTLDFEQLTGGYAGKSFDVPTVAKDDTNEITIRMYEFSGSPIREYMDMWITGISDINTGLTTFHNARSADGTRVKVRQSNMIAEAFYVATGSTGRSDDIEYSCFFTNMMPKQSTKDHFNYTSGEHKIVEISQTFTCVKYESPQINEVAKALINKYIIIRDYLDFKSGWGTTDKTNAATDTQYVKALPNSQITAWNADDIALTDYASDAEFTAKKTETYTNLQK